MIFTLVSFGAGAPWADAAAGAEPSLAPAVRSANSVKVQVIELHPFTHMTSIPVTSDPATINFEKVKATKVFTKMKSTMDPLCGNELQFRDPGGSMYCPYVQDDAAVPAYEVTYSYIGQPLASDEYGNRHFTFYVEFRPEELPPTLLKALSAGKVKRAELATYFNVTTSHPEVRATVIDERKSSVCDGNYVDGNWMRTDPNCRDKLTLKNVTVPSDYLTVEVEPLSDQTQQAARADRQNRSSEPLAGKH